MKVMTTFTVLLGFAMMTMVVARAAEPSRLTTLSDPSIRYTVPANPYLIVKRGDTEAVIVDNSAVDNPVLPGHRAGYSGVASLKHSMRHENLFQPSSGGLNFEFIHDGMEKDLTVLFEPRRVPMQLRQIDQYTVELYQAPTPHWGLESALRYHLLSDGTIEMIFECIPRRPSFKNGYIGLFWANYIHHPESPDIYFRGYPGGAGPIPRWIRGTSPTHGELSTHLAADDQREFKYAVGFPLTLVSSQSTYRYAEPWYYGVSHGMAYVLLFRERDQIRLTQSPSGGGIGIPAWDFQFFISGFQLDQLYQMVMRAMYVPYESPEQIQQLSEPHRKALNLSP